MAVTRVNKKFVIKFAAILTVGAGVVIVGAYYLLSNTGADLIRRGDASMALAQSKGQDAKAADKEYENAAFYYSKAVNKEQTNVAFLEKWRAALASRNPDTTQKYREALSQYVIASRQIAVADSTNVDAQRRYLDLLVDRQAVEGVSRQAMELLESEATTIINLHAARTPTGPWEVLKRYRGIARTRIATVNPDATQEMIEGAKADLEAALAQNPGDIEAALAMIQWHDTAAQKAREQSRAADVEAEIAAGDAVLASQLARSPEEPMMLLESVRRDYVRTLYASRGDQTIDAAAVTASFQERNLPVVERAAAAAALLPPARIDIRLVNTLKYIESMVDPRARGSRTEELIRTALAARPNDPELLITRAEVIAAREDFDGAIAAAQALVDMPLAPVSSLGEKQIALRPDAIFRQANWMFRKYYRATDDAAKAKALADARGLRERLAALEASDQPRMLLIDANLALIDRKLPEAARLVEQFNKLTNNAIVDGLQLAANVSLARNYTGEARERLQQVLRLQPTNLSATLVLAQVEMQLQNDAAAEALYASVLRMVPDNPTAKEGLELARAKLGRGSVSDPVTQALLEADRLDRSLAASNDPTRGATITAMLERSAERFNQDPRIVQAIALAHMREGARDKALSAIQASLEKHPESTELRRLLVGLQETDPNKSRLALIEFSDASALDKSLQRYSVYRDMGDNTRAEAELDAAARIDPNHPGVVEMQFMRAIEAQNFAVAQTLTDQAARLDSDKAEGLTFRARLQATQGNLTEAIRTMEQVTARGGVQPEAWRLKARLENLAGRSNDAVTSLRAALALRPSDPAAINDLIGSLANLGRREEALTVSREFQRYAAGDEVFLDNWLTLEASLGDRTMAKTQRERIFRASPGNRENSLTLAALYMDDGELEKARPLVTHVRSTADGLDAVSLDAAWYYAKNDRTNGVKVFDDFIAAQPTPSATPLLAKARFLLARREVEGAIAALEAARPLQDPKVAEADKSLADALFGLGKFEESLAATQRVMNMSADTPDGMYRKRAAELLLTLKRPADAEKMLAPLMTGTQPDALALVLAADAKGALNDKAGQRRLLEQAVARFPNNPTVFVKRGQMWMADDSTLTDAVKDFDKAISLSPNMWQAHRFRAQANTRLNRPDEALNDLAAALRANPGDNELLSGLLTDLMRQGRDQDAERIAGEAVRARPRDVTAMYAIGNFFANNNKWVIASRFFRQAYDLDKRDFIVQRHLDALLATDTPNINDASAVLDDIGERANSNAGFLMARAKVRMKQGRPAEAGRAAIDSLRLLDTNADRDMLAWYNDARRIFTDRRQLIQFLEASLQSGVAPEWLNLFRGLTMVDDAGTRESGIRLLGELLISAKTKPVRQFAHRSIGTGQYLQGQYQASVTAYLKGLEEFPDDPEMNNNAAYIMATNLGNPRDALPMALKAAALSPDNADSQDSLGVIHKLLGNNAESETAFRRGLETATTLQSAASISAHLADLLVVQGKKKEALEVLNRIAEFMLQAPESVTPQTKADLLEARQKAEAP